MTQEVCQEVVTTYLKQLRLSRMAREFFSDRYERASVAITSNLAFA